MFGTDENDDDSMDSISIALSLSRKGLFLCIQLSLLVEEEFGPPVRIVKHTLLPPPLPNSRRKATNRTELLETFFGQVASSFFELYFPRFCCTITYFLKIHISLSPYSRFFFPPSISIPESFQYLGRVCFQLNLVLILGP